MKTFFALAITLLLLGCLSTETAHPQEPALPFADALVALARNHPESSYAVSVQFASSDKPTVFLIAPWNRQVEAVLKRGVFEGVSVTTKEEAENAIERLLRAFSEGLEQTNISEPIGILRLPEEHAGKTKASA